MIILFYYCYFYCCFDMILVFFFKQKTAYEMRISDWSSDVCSSDLSHSGRKRLPSNPPLILISRRIRIRARVNRRLGRPRRIRVNLAQRLNKPPAPNPVIRLISRIKQLLIQQTRQRTEERIVGRTSVRTCRFRGATLHKKKKKS